MNKSDKDELLHSLEHFVECGLKSGKSYTDIFYQIDNLAHDAIDNVVYGYAIDDTKVQ